MITIKRLDSADSEGISKLVEESKEDGFRFWKDSLLSINPEKIRFKSQGKCWWVHIMMKL
ncbi:hypothetical protein MGI18_04050 [Bacillus sp. OVS6]|nr:hypothetical protein MGI18_04050 [Bacillus sp. OVS6]